MKETDRAKISYWFLDCLKTGSIQRNDLISSTLAKNSWDILSNLNMCLALLYDLLDIFQGIFWLGWQDSDSFFFFSKLSTIAACGLK